MSLFFVLQSCSLSNDSEVPIEVQSHEDIEAKSIVPTAALSGFKIEFLKTPKRDSTSCSTGFGFCVTLVIIFSDTEDPNQSIYYDETSEEVNFVAKLVEENKVELHFPSEINKSLYHDNSDFNSFDVPEDIDYGDVTFLAGSYDLQENEEGVYVYEIDVVENGN